MIVIFPYFKIYKEMKDLIGVLKNEGCKNESLSFNNVRGKLEHLIFSEKCLAAVFKQEIDE